MTFVLKPGAGGLVFVDLQLGQPSSTTAHSWVRLPLRLLRIYDSHLMPRSNGGWWPCNGDEIQIFPSPNQDAGSRVMIFNQLIIPLAL